ncbi:MAG: HAMP domain-containing histidine kinase [Chloroflexi bacterium]|nr:HAMP domain-containing histidine kinase [Chloroflexota bacterium]
MFTTLRTKLVISYVILVAIIVLIAMLVAGSILSAAQRDVGFTRAQNTLIVLAQRIRSSPMPHQAAMALLSDGEGMREPLLLVTSEGRVVEAAGQGADDLGSEIPPISMTRPVSGAVGTQGPIYITNWTSPGNQRYYLAYIEVNVPMTQGPSAHYLVVAIPASDVDPPWQSLIGAFILLGCAILLAAVVGAFGLAQSITNPLQRMTKAADAMARGDYQQRLDIKGRDEVAQLADSFNRMAEAVDRTNRAQRDLLTNVSHDLRTPLTSIDGFSQAILDGEIHSEDDYKKAATIIHAETLRMQRLVNEIIDVAKIESGALNISPEPLDWNDLVSTELNQARARILQNGIQITAVYGDLPKIYGDTFKLRQAIRNLIDNASKYAHPGTTISLCTGSNTTADTRIAGTRVAYGSLVNKGEWIYFSISNSFEPVNPEKLALFFNRFYRGDESRSQPEGSGLGLAIAREVILAHGGRVEAISNDSIITFILWLPVRSASS